MEADINTDLCKFFLNQTVLFCSTDAQIECHAKEKDSVTGRVKRNLRTEGDGVSIDIYIFDIDAGMNKIAS